MNPLKEKLKEYLISQGYPNSVLTFNEPTRGKSYYDSLPYHDLRVNVTLQAIIEAARFIIRENLSADDIALFTDLDSKYDNLRDSLYLANMKDGGFEFFHFKEGKWLPSSIPSYFELMRYRLQHFPKEYSVFIKNVTLNNFSVFEETFFTFSVKLNVITGENGSGKSHLLKILYAMHNASSLFYRDSPNGELSPYLINLKDIFKVNVEELISTKHTSKEALGSFNYFDRSEKRTFTISPQGQTTFSDDFQPTQNLFEPIFIPSHNIFSLLPYDYTKKERDVTNEALAARLHHESQYDCTQIEFSEIMQRIQTAINGKFLWDKDTRCLKLQLNDSKFERSLNLIADGWKKIGIILQLLDNMALHPGCILFWDEPEANLNPRLIRLIAACIVELADWGIQVFLTTHSLFLMREIELLSAVKKFKDGDVCYINLLGDGNFEQGNSIDDLDELLLLDESLLQADRYLKQDF